jgi:hypothetical protein
MRRAFIYVFIGLQVLCGHVLSSDKKNIYSVDLTKMNKDAIKTGHLKLGGQNFLGESYEVNNYYLQKNGQPWIPIMGEFHFSRYPAKYWDESIKKMKAGGIEVIATYVFWIMHEEEEGIFDWSGDKNLRMFLELCKANDMKVILRIGPFCHGEIRNGGLPDWLLGKALSIRSNDSLYLQYVERLYHQISLQLTGLLFKDGGPVIGIQLENEYQHSASPWGIAYPGEPYDWTTAEQDRSITQAGVGSANPGPSATIEYGNKHLKILKQLAQNEGMEVPLYTATGWGYAAIIENETLPLTSAYPYPTWAPISLSPMYLYKDLHSNPDYSPVRYIPEDYPNVAAEIGAGIMVRYERRPTVPEKSLDALINRFLGSGSNGIGYYMFHGGSTPKGNQVYYSDEAYGYPKISYDFQAPIGEFGQIRPSFARLKVLHYFIQAFGSQLATMRYVPIQEQKLSPDNTSMLRFAIRSNVTSSFIFMLNFQDHHTTQDISNIQLSIHTASGNIQLPQQPFTLKSEENAIFPLQMKMGSTTLNYATAQPLTKFKNQQTTYYIFFAVDGIIPEFSFPSSTRIAINEGLKINNFSNQQIIAVLNNSLPAVISLPDQQIKMLIIDRKMAENCWIINSKPDTFLVFTKALLINDDKHMELSQISDTIFHFSVFPEVNINFRSNTGKLEKIKQANYLTSYQLQVPTARISVISEKIADNKLLLKIPATLLPSVSDYFLTVDYTGDVAMAFVDGRLVADDFYYGKKWQIGLKKFIDQSATEMTLYFRPLHADARFLPDLSSDQIPDFKGKDTYLKINSIRIEPEYRVVLGF